MIALPFTQVQEMPDAIIASRGNLPDINSAHIPNSLLSTDFLAPRLSKGVGWRQFHSVH
jgi:hypothetical protein